MVLLLFTLNKWTIFLHFPGSFIVDFEQVYVVWEEN